MRRKLNLKTLFPRNQGEHVGKEQSNAGIVIRNWKDNLNLLMISTKFDDNDEMLTIQKARVLFEYNKYESFIDISDQM